MTMVNVLPRSSIVSPFTSSIVFFMLVSFDQRSPNVSDHYCNDMGQYLLFMLKVIVSIIYSLLINFAMNTAFQIKTTQ